MYKNKFFKMLTQNTNYYIWLLVVFATVTLLYDVHVAVVEYLLVAFMSFIYYYNKFNRRKRLSKYINTLIYNFKDKCSDAVDDFAMPISGIDSGGKIVWNNSAFFELIGNQNVYKLPISDFIPEFNADEMVFKNKEVEHRIIHNGRYYHIFGNISALNPDDPTTEQYIALYWDDVTDFEILKANYDKEQFVCCVAVIDNYEEIMQDTSNQDRPKLVATIEEKLQGFADESKGILRKYEKDRFFLYFQKQYLEKYIENKFKILDEMKEISVGNKIPPTLSLGIGVGGDSFIQNDIYSFSALDMALGRGGDQAIIKDKDQFSFYGGRSNGFEKRTRVKSRVVAYAIRELINESNNIFIMGHTRADIDVLGSALGLYRAFKTLGKEAKIVIDQGNQTVQKFISLFKNEYKGVFISRSQALESVTSSSLVFVVDTHRVSLVEAPELLEISKKIIVIDHHRKSADSISNPIINYHEPYASSTSELVTEVVQYIDNNVVLTQADAHALYAGIYMDTKSFTFKTGVRTFEAASYLKRRGVDTITIKMLFQTDMNAFLKRWSIIVDAERVRDKIALAVCEKNDVDMLTIVAQATDEMLNITNITAAFVICDMHDYITISARSLGDINVQIILEKLGGGGHVTMAGAQLSDITVDEATEKLKNAINEYFENL